MPTVSPTPAAEVSLTGSDASITLFRHVGDEFKFCELKIQLPTSFFTLDSLVLEINFLEQSCQRHCRNKEQHKVFAADFYHTLTTGQDAADPNPSQYCGHGNQNLLGSSSHQMHFPL